jgi:hypothetical protein
MIQSVGKDGTSIAIYVQNVGDGTVELSSLYINSAKINEAQFFVGGLPEATLPKGQTAKVTGTWLADDKYLSPNTVKIKIVCADGTFTEVSLNNIIP